MYDALYSPCSKYVIFAFDSVWPVNVARKVSPTTPYEDACVIPDLAVEGQ